MFGVTRAALTSSASYRVMSLDILVLFLRSSELRLAETLILKPQDIRNAWTRLRKLMGAPHESIAAGTGTAHPSPGMLPFLP